MHHLSKKTVFAFHFFIAATLFSAFVSGAHAEDAAQHLLTSISEVTGVPGLSAAVSKDGTIIWTGTTGYRDHSKTLSVNTETKFRIASVSKLFAASLVLRAAENGILNLDTGIRTYVPNWPDHNGAKITLRNLAAHTSGIGHYGGDDRYDAMAHYENLTDSISIFAHKPLLAEPGQEYSYSSYGYALMGAALEKTTTKSFAENLQSVITKPLRLTNTEPENIDSLPENTTDLFHQNGNPITRNDQSHVVGATGILSTPSDLVRFATAYAAGQIVSSESIAMSWEPFILNNGDPAGTSRFEIGFGWRIGSDWAGNQVYSHAGTTPGARSILSINPTKQTAVALLSNAQWVSRIETTAELLATAALEGPNANKDTCNIGAWNFTGVFVEDENNPPMEDNAKGIILIQQTEDNCTGRIIPTESLARWLEERGSKTPYIPLTLVADENVRTKVFAAVTPWGAFPLHLSNESDSLVVSGDFAGRVVSLMAPITAQSP